MSTERASLAGGIDNSDQFRRRQLLETSQCSRYRHLGQLDNLNETRSAMLYTIWQGRGGQKRDKIVTSRVNGWHNWVDQSARIMLVVSIPGSGGGHALQPSVLSPRSPIAPESLLRECSNCAEWFNILFLQWWLGKLFDYKLWISELAVFTSNSALAETRSRLRLHP